MAIYQLRAYNNPGFYRYDIYDKEAGTVIYAASSEEIPYPNMIWEGENRLPSYVQDPVTGLTYTVVGIGKMSFYYGDYNYNEGLPNIPAPEVILPETLEFIDEAAFVYCEHIVSVTIPESLKKIGQWAFFGNLSLTTIINYSPVPQELENYVFMAKYDYETDIYTSYTENCTLYVCPGSEEKYRDWGGYKWKDVRPITDLNI